MKPPALFHHDETGSNADYHNQYDKPCEEPQHTIADDESHYRTACCSGRPVDVATLNTQEFKRLLKPLENRVSGICFFCHKVRRYRRTWAVPGLLQSGRCKLRLPS